ncbi:TetR/AcrR family transcriptional regulator [Peribacillus frigoritolerans]|jgi:TetR/AcrR family transcriptional regulator, cholesterol catabolism regulator|uniref:TetR/AcrR family transcriptional regulator n=1 Tax=Peribacillus TaxID=2675229 RepID=UPI0006AC96DD|nr:TetR/AcrR family transcriptional regulator [Peribacillus frigoritolerans]KOR81130.1 TetR family transcriptional regulator [Bacillus sp. FJAT-21352]KOR85191.1 TetR family transcriptional regulator [Bacillus sp. FJAT-22058]MCY9137470.1 TetR/AcrR family transcriptional regulator [Peribacillus frigoritolerans]MDM5309066.1 TetR/AcrR family transcriptional regulator [Peribacillus frigoritolerans]MED4688167.1 TetR/AcrR family transcriptional regulator [Peribacillus frigoritolerans]
MEKREVLASVKDERLVEKRRTQMIKGAVTLFKEKGFHRTTTREIAKAAGFSIGTLYEYIRTKEDILYLVCDYIYDEVQEKLQKEIEQSDGTLESLKLTIAYFYKVMDDMQDEVLVMYQEVKALTKDALPYVLNKELRMVGMFEKVITKCVENGELSLTEKQISLVSHNIFVQGQMWSFRRWALHKQYTLQEYVELQTQLLIQNVSGSKVH